MRFEECVCLFVCFLTDYLRSMAGESNLQELSAFKEIQTILILRQIHQRIFWRSFLSKIF